MKIWRHLFVCLWVSVSMATGAIPDEILILEEDEYCMTRLELTGGEIAYLNEGNGAVEGIANEVDGSICVRFIKPKRTFVLTHEGERWVEAAGRVWVPRAQLRALKPTWTKVQVKLVDQKKHPITDFRYSYTTDSEDGWWDPLLVRPQSPDPDTGKIEFFAPRDCSIQLTIDHPEFIQGYGASPEFQRVGGKVEFQVEAKRGVTVIGTVVAEKDGKPLSGASIAPLIAMPPGFSPDWTRKVVTGANGRFEIPGVDPSLGIRIEHDDYLDSFVDTEKETKGIVVRMKSGLQLSGSVVDENSQPLAGVYVYQEGGKTTLTDAAGKFTLRGIQDWEDGFCEIGFSKDGFRDFGFREKRIAAEGVNIRLTELPVLRGHIFLSNGSPATKFSLSHARGPEPSSISTDTIEVEHAEGQFRFKAEESPKFWVEVEEHPKEAEPVWIGVQAESHAPTQQLVPLAELTTGNFRVDLKPGHSLTARLLLPANAIYPLGAELRALDFPLPEDDFPIGGEIHPAEALHSQSTKLQKGAPLRLTNLIPGNYRLTIVGEKITPHSESIEIGEGDLDLGEIKLRGTGSISGLARKMHGSKPWKFADGSIDPMMIERDDDLAMMRFKTDAEGKFHVKGVPSGLVEIGLRRSISADIVGSVNRQARVVEGQDTEIRFEGDQGEWAQPLELLFGGNKQLPSYESPREVSWVTTREPLFDFALTALGDGSFSGPVEASWYPKEKQGPIIPDLSPGKWRVVVSDGHAGRGKLAMADFEVGAERKPIQIKLGDRAITGKVTSSRDNLRYIQIIALGRTSGRSFIYHGDGDGDFICRYLPEDRYLIHAHDNQGGWCNLGEFDLAEKLLSDCGEHTLAEGGSISGIVGPALRSDRNLNITAIANDGITIQVDAINAAGQFKFGNLRPGKWTIKVQLRAQTIAVHNVDVARKSDTILPAIRRR